MLALYSARANKSRGGSHGPLVSSPALFQQRSLAKNASPPGSPDAQAAKMATGVRYARHFRDIVVEEIRKRLSTAALDEPDCARSAAEATIEPATPTYSAGIDKTNYFAKQTPHATLSCWPCTSMTCLQSLRQPDWCIT